MQSSIVWLAKPSPLYYWITALKPCSKIVCSESVEISRRPYSHQKLLPTLNISWKYKNLLPFISIAKFVCTNSSPCAVDAHTPATPSKHLLQPTTGCGGRYSLKSSYLFLYAVHITLIKEIIVVFRKYIPPFATWAVVQKAGEGLYAGCDIFSRDYTLPQSRNI